MSRSLFDRFDNENGDLTKRCYWKVNVAGFGPQFLFRGVICIFQGAGGGVTLCQSENTHHIVTPSVVVCSSLATPLLRSIFINLRDLERWGWETRKFGTQFTRICFNWIDHGLLIDLGSLRRRHFLSFRRRDLSSERRGSAPEESKKLVGSGKGLSEKGEGLLSRSFRPQRDRKTAATQAKI